MSEIVHVDAASVDELLRKLDDDELKNKILYDAVMSGAKALQQAAQQNIRKELGAAASHPSPYLKGNKPLYEGVSVKGEKAYIEASVSILNDFRMKFFEKGTAERYTKGHKITGYADNGRNLKREGKGHYTGKITATNFFAAARNSSEQNVNDAMLSSIEKSLKNAIKQ
ncbi:MAG: hypothetical protein MR788_06025 [Prevotella sp.]|nr:hypothetical protein [Prevotella sp.]